MKIHLSNLPANVEPFDLCNFIDKTLDIDDELALNSQVMTVILDGDIGFVDIESRWNKKIDPVQVVQLLDDKLFNEHTVRVRHSTPHDLGQYMVSRIQGLRVQEDYHFSNIKIQRKWTRAKLDEPFNYPENGEDCYRCYSNKGLEEFDKFGNEILIPDLTNELNLIAQTTQMQPIRLSESLIAPLFDFRLPKINIDVYEAMVNDKNTLLVHAFVRYGKPDVKCWRAIAISNSDGTISRIPMPRYRYWREIFEDFLNGLRGLRR